MLKRSSQPPNPCCSPVSQALSQPWDLGRAHLGLAVPVLGQGIATHNVLGHQPKLSLQRCSLTGSPEPLCKAPTS